MTIEIIETVCDSAVWVVGVITFGKMGMFAMRHFLPKTKTDDKSNAKADAAADALNQM